MFIIMHIWFEDLITQFAHEVTACNIYLIVLAKLQILIAADTNLEEALVYSCSLVFTRGVFVLLKSREATKSTVLKELKLKSNIKFQH